MKIREKTTAILITILMISTLAVAIIASPEYVLQTDTYGEAEMRYNQERGNYVFLSDGGVGLLDDELAPRVPNEFGMGRVVIKGVNTLLSAITTLSYDFHYSFPTSIIHPDFQAFPYMVLECVADGDGPADLWIVLISTQIEHDAHSQESMPTLDTWTTWTLAGYDNWHDAGPESTPNIGQPTSGATLQAMKTAYTSARVLNVKVAVGEWASGEYDAITGNVDDIEINGVTYDFEEESEGPVSLIVNTGEVFPVVRISVDETSLDFGRIDEGSSGVETVTITNEGDVAVYVDASLIDEVPLDFFTDNLELDEDFVVDWFMTISSPGNYAVDLTLTVPEGTGAGPKTATLVFWAEIA